MKLKKCLSAAALVSLSLPTLAITIVNNNSQQVTYTIATNGFLSKCAEGTLGVGGRVQWLSSGPVWLHPLCGGEGPKHVEISVRGLSPIPVNCTPANSHNPRLSNQGTTVTISSTQYGIECYTSS